MDKRSFLKSRTWSITGRSNRKMKRSLMVKGFRSTRNRNICLKEISKMASLMDKLGLWRVIEGQLKAHSRIILWMVKDTKCNTIKLSLIVEHLLRTCIMDKEPILLMMDPILREYGTVEKWPRTGKPLPKITKKWTSALPGTTKEAKFICSCFQRTARYWEKDERGFNDFS